MPGRGPATVSTADGESDCIPEFPEQSGTFRQPISPRLSQTFWRLDFTQGLPRELSKDGIVCTRGELDRVRDFLARVFPTLTEEGLAAAPLDPRLLHTKRWYLGQACDLLELRKGGETIGVMIGAPEDWSTYYLRVYAVDPKYQRPIVTRRFAECVLNRLVEHGVQRIVTDTSPTNVVAARRLGELQFYVTGQQLSERYGPLIRYTKFLDPAAEAAFVARFAGSAPPRANKTRKPKEEP